MGERQQGQLLQHDVMSRLHSKGNTIHPSCRTLLRLFGLILISYLHVFFAFVLHVVHQVCHG